MLSRAQINKAINDKIKSEFPGIMIQSTDVEEGFDRPSFFVSLETNRIEPNQFSTLREMTCRVLFFPSDRSRYKEEAYDIQDRLEKLFGLNFDVGGRTITVDSASADIIDKVVHYDFDFSYYDDSSLSDNGENEELMQELRYNG